MDFEKFTAAVRAAGEEHVNPGMTVAELGDAVRSVAISIVEEAGGGAALFSRHPELLQTTVDTRRFMGQTVSVGDVLQEVAAGSLLAVLQPVWRGTMVDSFHKGFVAAVEQTLAFVVAAGPHARGVINQETLDILEDVISRITDGAIDQSDLARGMIIAERKLKMLTNLDDGSRIARAIGGAAEIRAQYDVAEKLLLVRMGDVDDFYHWFVQELEARREATVGAR